MPKNALDPRPGAVSSGRDVAPLYGPADVANLDYARDLGDPGSYPFTRGIHASM